SLDGKILAVSHSSRIVRLLEHATGQELARLAAPHAVEIVGLYFSADGSQLAARSLSHIIQVWDLRLIRAQLAAMGLDWDLPPYPPGEDRGPGPLRVEVDAVLAKPPEP